MFRKKEIQSLNTRIEDLKKEVKTLSKENNSLKNDRGKNREFLHMLDESIPKEEIARKKYMGDVTAFHQLAFKEKLKHFISMQYEELGRLGHTDKEYELYRSNINCFFLIDEWMLKCTREHLGDLATMRQKAVSDDEFITKMKDLY